MAKRLIPSLNRILVEKIVPPSKTNAGILLPEKTTKLNSGKVVAVGPGSRDRDGKLIPVSFKQGDVVLLPEYGGTEVKLAEKEFHLYRDDDILGLQVCKEESYGLHPLSISKGIIKSGRKGKRNGLCLGLIVLAFLLYHCHHHLFP